MPATRSQAGFPTIEQLGLFKLEAWGAPIWIYQARPLPSSRLVEAQPIDLQWPLGAALRAGPCTLHADVLLCRTLVEGSQLTVIVQSQLINGKQSMLSCGR